MPSPSKRYAQQRTTSPAARRGGAGNNNNQLSSLESVHTNNQRKNPPEQQQQQQQKYDPSTVGKRTGVILPPRGEIPFDANGLEDADAFFAAAQSPLIPPSSPGGGSGGSPSGNAYGKRAEKVRERERREEEKRRRREELEEEGRRPDILNRNGNDSDDGNDSDGGGKPRAKPYQRTPKQPHWSNRLLHQAMGVPTEDSPQFTVLSKVSTAAPSTHGSIDTIATESRHGLRGEQSGMQLERLAEAHENSPAAEGGDDDSASENAAGPMDPPEEMSRDGSNGGPGEKRGVDPEERDHYMEPEDAEEDVSAKPSAKSASSAKSAVSSQPDALENSLEEVVESNYNNQDYDNDDEGDGGMQLATQQDDQFGEEEDFGGGGNDGGFDDDDLMDNDAVSQQASQKSRGSHASSKSDMSRMTKSQMSEQQRPPSEEEEEEEPPKKKKAKKDKAAKQAPVTPTSVLRTKKSKKKKQTSNRVNFSTPNGTSTGRPAGNRDYESVPVSNYKDEYPPGEEPRTPGGSTLLRRSGRAKFKPLQYWKNEKLIYEAQNEKGLLGEAMGDMPVVSGVMHALPTPYKEVKRREEQDRKKKKKRKADSDDDDEDTTVKSPFDDKALRKKHRIHNGESGSVWSETLEKSTDIKIVSRIDNRTFSKLPLSSTRKSRESKVVGFASQSFHVPTDDDDLFPGYIAGNVVLPPRGIKDAEGVGLCSQVFNVGDCQPGALEFALADPSGQDGEFDPKTSQRFLLSKGDMFQIPPGNVYRIENHSKTAKATLFWTIIKCTSRAEQEEEDSEEDD